LIGIGCEQEIEILTHSRSHIRAGSSCKKSTCLWHFGSTYLHILSKNLSVKDGEGSSKFSERMSVRHVNKTMTMSFTRQSHRQSLQCSVLQFLQFQSPHKLQTVT